MEAQNQVHQPQQMMSPEIDQLAKALAQVQGSLSPVSKDKKNPFFKSSYADLCALWESCRSHLAKNKISVVQGTMERNGDMYLETTMCHESGQWIKGHYLVKPDKQTPQGYGSAVTYARRYALAGMLGITVTDEDDDGEGAMNRNRKPTPQPTPKPEPTKPNPKDFTPEQWKDIADKYIAKLKAAEDVKAYDKIVIDWQKTVHNLDQYCPEQKNRVVEEARDIYSGLVEI